MPIPIYQVDAFTARAFRGNPAAVCLLDHPRDAAWMQSLAEEMNLSETTFLVRRDDGYDLRWFTPTVEVDLCGHATLASAHVLWETGLLQEDEPAQFHTRSGLLTARRQGDWIELDFPVFTVEKATPPTDVVNGLGVQPVSVWFASNEENHVVELESEQVVRSLNPDFNCFRRLPTGVLVTARADAPDVDFVSRYFGSAFGIDEDPVTGSAHCVLGPFWQSRLGKNSFIAHQVSRRGGVLRVRVENQRTFIAGQAVTVFCGELADAAEAS